MVENELLVRKIESGTVIDHIPAGKAFLVLKILKVNPSAKMVIALNVISRKMKTKDIIKIEGKFLTKEEVDIISLVAPTATINTIKNWKVSKKYRVKLPEIIKEIMKCPNYSCITNGEREPVKTKFRVIKSKKEVIIQCMYCDTLIPYNEVVDNIIAK